MHTGGSVWLALFALHQARRDRRFRVPAALTTFLAANIVAATLVLRWHYVVDVIAGLALASLVAALAFSLAPRETARRRALGLPDVWGFD
jgi:membrane-associated phospholipid phosphatase